MRGTFPRKAHARRARQLSPRRAWQDSSRGVGRGLPRASFRGPSRVIPFEPDTIGAPSPPPEPDPHAEPALHRSPSPLTERSPPRSLGAPRSGPPPPSRAPAAVPISLAAAAAGRARARRPRTVRQTRKERHPRHPPLCRSASGCRGCRSLRYSTRKRPFSSLVKTERCPEVAANSDTRDTLPRFAPYFRAFRGCRWGCRWGVALSECDTPRRVPACQFGRLKPSSRSHGRFVSPIRPP